MSGALGIDCCGCFEGEGEAWSEDSEERTGVIVLKVRWCGRRGVFVAGSRDCDWQRMHEPVRVLLVSGREVDREVEVASLWKALCERSDAAILIVVS